MSNPAVSLTAREVELLMMAFVVVKEGLERHYTLSRSFKCLASEAQGLLWKEFETLRSKFDKAIDNGLVTIDPADQPQRKEDETMKQ